MSKIVTKMNCLRCGYTWESVHEEGFKPSLCPSCKSYHYDKPRVRKFTARVWKAVGAVVEGGGVQ